MKDTKNMVMVIIIGITIILFLFFNTTVFATTGIVTTSDLRLRKEESTSSEILKLLDENSEVEIISENGDWYKVKSGNEVGYVSKEYIKVKESNTTSNETNTDSNNTTENNVETNNTVDANQTTESEQTENQEQNVETEKIKQGIAIEETQIRVLPLINSDVINTAEKSEKYEIVSSVGVWSYAKSENKSGWILTQKLTIAEQDKNSVTSEESTTTTTENEEQNDDEQTTSEKEETEITTEETKTESKTYYVKGTSVNARSEASKSSTSIKKLDTNDKVTVTGEEGDWYIVEIDGQKAYILKTLLSSKKVETTSRSSSSVTSNTETTSATETTTETTTTATTATTETTTASSASGEAVVAYAKTFLGYKYKYGTNGPSTFDCSGFTQYVYKHFGYSLSRSSKSQANDGVAVSKENLQPGDILIFKNTAKTAIGHVGIYIGNNQFIHASNEKTGVIISSLSTASYQQRYVSARRIL